MRIRASTIASCVTVAALMLVGCADQPRVQEEFPTSRPWFKIAEVEVEEGGRVLVVGDLLAEASQVESSAVDATFPADAGEFPDHIAYGFWPAPDEVGVGEAVDVGADGSFAFQYDFSRPEGLREGWHVLQFDKADWGSQFVWVNVGAQEWSEDAPP